MNIPLVDLKAQYQSIKDDVLDSISRIFDGMHLLLGEHTQAFEREFAAFCGTRFGVGVGSGTDALHLALRAVGVQPGDEVMTVSHTFIATVEPILYCGATPIFVEIDPATALMDVAQVEARITNKTRAIVPVHLYGQMVEMAPLMEIADRHGLPVVEDASQAHGAVYRGQRAGSIGRGGCFSFYFSKNLGAYGEAGMVVTNDEAIATRVRMLRNHGQEVRYTHTVLGYNARIDEIQSAVLRIKLARLEAWNALRRQHATEYTRRLAGSAVIPITESAEAAHVYHLYVIRSARRDALRTWLDARGVATGIHYPIPVHRQPMYRERAGDVSLPVTEWMAGEILSLPMFPELQPEQIAYICECLAAFPHA